MYTQDLYQSIEKPLTGLQIVDFQLRIKKSIEKSNYNLFMFKAGECNYVSVAFTNVFILL